VHRHGKVIDAIGSVRAKSVEVDPASSYLFDMINRSPFRYFKTSPEIIRLAMMM
jgi:hypothetical protein